MEITAQELCQLLGGRLEGDPTRIVTHPAKIEEAGQGSVSFIANPKYIQFAASTKADVLVVAEDLQLSEGSDATLIRVADPYSSFTEIIKHFAPEQEELRGVDANASIMPGATVDQSAFVGAFTVVSKGASVAADVVLHPQVFLGRNVSIGAGSVLYPGVKVYDHCAIGAGCILHSGAVIGSDGFGFAPKPDGSYEKIPQGGNVVLEDQVEIGANATIDRATMGSTVIKRGAKVDNLVQVAHNAEIGSHSVLAAQCGISGSTKLGKYVMVGGQAGVVGHLTIADGSKINAQSGVNKSIKKAGTAVTGSPAFDYTSELRNQVIYRRLPQMEQRLSILEAKLKSLE